MKKQNRDGPNSRAEAEKKRRSSLIKLGSVMILAFIVWVFSSIAWFSMNKDVTGSGMSISTTAGLFELKTSGSEGLYDDYITRIDNEYSDGSQTTPSSPKLILQLTNDNQMENLWKKNTPPSQGDLDDIKQIESTQYGLSPGDCGVLKFSIVPVYEDSESFNVLIKPVISCYKTEYYTANDTGHTPGHQKDSITAMDPSNTAEAAAIGFTNTHISMYYMADENNDDVDEMHLISDEGFVVNNITSETVVEIYWFWPKELINILNLDIEDMDSSGAAELRKELFASPDDYLEKINVSDDFSSIVISESGTESARNTKAQEIVNSPTTYSYYSNRYNNADQTIGDKVGYIMVEIIADQAD